MGETVMNYIGLSIARVLDFSRCLGFAVVFIFVFCNFRSDKLSRLLLDTTVAF